MDEVDAMVDAAPEPPKTPPVPPAARRRPKTSDHQSKKKSKPKLKVRTLTREETETDDDGNETKRSVPYGREVTIRTVKVTVLDTALGDFQTTDDLSLLGEAAEELEARGEKADVELLTEATARVSPLLRRLVGVAGSREVLSMLRRESDEGVVGFEDVVSFMGELIQALSPNS